ncbi:hypothetical protein [Aliiglaciecola litoralis]|uniref:Uncharacterized protein n=1 Tax=Aliiglaciecola litoralis TaxID=582857 RepID=A0ABP3X1G7_9ALTE
MVTVLKNWSMVYLFGLPDGSQMHQRWGRVVTGEVLLDGKHSHVPGDKICTDAVLRSPGNLVHTRTGEVYSLFGQGATLELPVTQLQRLQRLESASQIAIELGSGWRKINSDES